LPYLFDLAPPPKFVFFGRFSYLPSYRAPGYCTKDPPRLEVATMRKRGQATPHTAHPPDFAIVVGSYASIRRR
jgi:hypothetical protein